MFPKCNYCLFPLSLPLKINLFVVSITLSLPSLSETPESVKYFLSQLFIYLSAGYLDIEVCQLNPGVQETQKIVLNMTLTKEEKKVLVVSHQDINFLSPSQLS